MQKLIEYLDAERGRRVKLAKALEISPASLSGWHQVPSARVAEVERITGIHRQFLRPDLFQDMKPINRKIAL
jgi:DNA-binding transcriptional regulator YdaS (Cro superfamily)